MTSQEELAPDVVFAPIPTWVKMWDADTSADMGSSEDRNRLVDLQFLVEEYVSTRFMRHRFFLATTRDLNNSISYNIRIGFAVEEVVIHHVQVMRGDKLIRLDDQIKEQPSHFGKNDGSGNLRLLIPGLHLNDEVEICYSCRQRPSHIPWSMQGDYRSKQLSKNDFLRVVVTSPKELHSSGCNGLHYRHFEVDGAKIHEWGPEKTTLLERNDDVDQFQLSLASSWEELSATLYARYSAFLVSDAEVLKIATEIDAIATNERQKVTFALRWIQNSISYLSSRSFEPKLPPETLRSRFGDCREQSLLLVSILTALGVKSRLTLVDSYRNLLNRSFKPSRNWFDHFVVEVWDNADQSRYWIDPMRTHQGGIGDNIFLPDYEFGLVLDPKGCDLTPVAGKDSKEPELSICDEYRFSDDKDTIAVLKASKTLRGPLADQYRMTIEENSKEQLSLRHQSEYSRFYELERGEHETLISDDIDANTITVLSKFKIPRRKFLADGHLQQFWLNPTAVNDLVRSTLESLRSDENKIYSRKHHVAHSVTILDAPGQLPTVPDIDVANSYFRLGREAEYQTEENRLSVNWTFSSKARPLDNDTRLDFEALLAPALEETNYWCHLSWEEPTKSVQPIRTFWPYLRRAVLWWISLGAVTYLVFWIGLLNQ